MPEVLDGHRMVVYQHVVRQLEVTVQLLLAVMVELIYYTAALAAVGVLMVMVLLAAAAAGGRPELRFANERPEQTPGCDKGCRRGLRKAVGQVRAQRRSGKTTEENPRLRKMRYREGERMTGP